MRDVRIKKQVLIGIVTKNRAEHRDIFLEAQKKYRDVVINPPGEKLKAARDMRPFQIARITSMPVSSPTWCAMTD